MKDGRKAGKSQEPNVVRESQRERESQTERGRGKQSQQATDLLHRCSDMLRLCEKREVAPTFSSAQKPPRQAGKAISSKSRHQHPTFCHVLGVRSWLSLWKSTFVKQAARTCCLLSTSK